jgi:rhodanese-related sulfurtransferase
MEGIMSESAAKVSRISPARVKECLDAGEAIFILDVRPKRNDQEIPASFWFDPTDLLQADRIVLSARNDQLIVVYDDSPDEAISSQVAAKLVAHGYWNAHPLEGGMKAWKAEGFPIAPRPVETLIGTE